MRWSVSFEGNSYVVNDVHTEKKRSRQFSLYHGMHFFFLETCCFVLHLSNLRRLFQWLENFGDDFPMNPNALHEPSLGRATLRQNAWRVIGGVLVSASWLGLNWWDSMNLALVFFGIFEWSRRVHTPKMENWYPFRNYLAPLLKVLVCNL